MSHRMAGAAGVLLAGTLGMASAWGAYLIGTEGTANTLTGTAANDVLVGRDRADTLSGGGGDDAVYGSSGTDNVNGGQGHDLLDGGPEADTIDGGEGVDTASYAHSPEGVTVVLGGAASGNLGGDAAGDHVTNTENLVGSAYADTLTGSSGGERARRRPG